MTDLYTSEFLYYYKNQPNKKEVENYTHRGEAVNSHCGDDISIKIKVENGIIKDIGYRSDGCSISQGAMSILSEYLIGKSVKEVKDLSDDEFLKLLHIELTPARQSCAVNSLNSVRNALRDEKN